MLKKKITILALETSADETGAAVLLGDLHTRKFSLRSNVIYSQIAKHRVTGGIVPEVAAREHLPKVVPAIKTALNRARLTLPDIDAVAVTAGPGLATSLMIGVDTAKTLSYALRKPLVAINHLEGHLLSALPKNSKFEIRNSKLFPALGLIVSGGHTLLVLVHDLGKYRILGETLDDAAGEAFDKVAKILGLPYPGGPELAKLSEKGDPRKYDLPRPMLNQNNFDFSFAGLKTAVLYLYRDVIANEVRQSRGQTRLLRLRQLTDPRKDTKIKADTAASTQAAIVDVLVEKTIRAAKQFKIKTVLLGGGVSANKLLRQTLKRRIQKETNSELLTPPYQLTTDNAGMIAGAAFWHCVYGNTVNYSKIVADPNLRLKSWR